MKITYWFFLCCLILFNALTTDAQTKRGFAQASNDDYIRWLLTGQGKKPSKIPDEIFNLPENKHEEV
ncbi:MAG: hypothetical protein HYZ34_04690 [Ignavibacteriae bacterium]|nr:hypothetical protein [Ignavibacteriota bacterium]